MIRNFNDIRGYAAVAGLLLVALATGCASIGNPSGGPRDEQPPRFLHSNPAPGATGVSNHNQSIRLDFNEIVNIKDAFSKVVVSPPSKSVPRVSALGKRVNINFTDTPLPNTTYTIGFGDAIEDNNEGNQLRNFSYSFSTGPTIDTLRIAGMVADARTLEPMQGKLVGVHSNLSDTAVFSIPFLRVAKTDDRGRFSIEGLPAGKYRVYALDDIDNNNIYSSPDEALAFYDHVVSPTSEEAVATDSIFNFKTGTLDTVVQRRRTVYLPNDVLLRSFLTSRKQQFVSKYERPDSTRLTLTFNAPMKFPSLSVVGAPGMRDWYIAERSATNDTITLWLRNKSLVSTDTIRLAAGYERLDSLNRYEAYSDTLRFTNPRRVAPKAKKKSKKEQEADTVPPPTPLLDVTWTGGGTQDVNRPVVFTTATPLARLDTAKIHLEVKKDTVWRPLAIASMRGDTLNPRRFEISYPWEYGTQYRIVADTMALTGIYGLHTGTLNHEFKTRAEKEYSTLTLRLSGWPSGVPAVVELLNASDAVAAVAPVAGGSVTFRYLPAGKYYARVFRDINGDGEWTTGDLVAGRQAEDAYYYPKRITIKQNWNKDEAWDVFSTPVDEMKPQDILKNKPTPPKGRQNQSTTTSDEEEEEE